MKAGARLRTAAESRIRHLLQILVDTDHEEYASTLQWVGGHFDPAEFAPAAVKVDHPKKRWKKAFDRGVR